MAWHTIYEDKRVRVVRSDVLLDEVRIFEATPHDAINPVWREIYNGSIKGLLPYKIAFEECQKDIKGFTEFLKNDPSSLEQTEKK